MKVRHDHVTVFVVRPAGATHEFLQLRRSTGDYLGGTWQTVRGSGAADETSVQTALRELREEASLTPTEFYSLGVVETFYIAATDTVYHSPAFLALVAADALVSLNAEHDDFRWVASAETKRLFIWPSEWPLLRDAITNILGDGPSKRFLRLRPPL